MEKVKDENLHIEQLQLEYQDGTPVSEEERQRVVTLLTDCTEMKPDSSMKALFVIEKQNTYDFLVRGNYKAILQVIEIQAGEKIDEALKGIAMTDMIVLCEGCPTMRIDQLLIELPPMENGYIALILDEKLEQKIRFTLLYLPKELSINHVDQNLFSKLFDPIWKDMILHMIQKEKISIVGIQKYLQCDYPTATRIWDSLEMMGIISIINGHSILSIGKEDFLQLYNHLENK